MQIKNDLKTDIIKAGIDRFNQSGFKFTMDEIAKSLSISKKTIYTVFKDKESLLLAMVDYLFDGIKDSEKMILADTNLDTLQKIEKILGAMPECYKELDFSKLYELNDKFPKIYKQVAARLENGWEDTFFLINKGIEEGSIRNINIGLVKTMMEATLEQFFKNYILNDIGLSYQDALNQLVSIIMGGIKENGR